MPSRSSRQAFHEYKQQLRSTTNRPADWQESSPEGGQKKQQRDRTFFQLFQQFWGLLEGKRRVVILALATLTVSTSLSLVPPFATKLAIDCVLTTPPKPLPTPIAPWLENLTPFARLAWIAVGVSMITLSTTAIHLWGRWLATRTVNQVQVRVRRIAFQHILHLPLYRIHAMKSGGATSMLREDAGGVGDLIFHMLYNPWQAIVQLLGSFIVLVLVDWRLLAAGVLLLPIVYYTHRTWIYRVRPLFKDVRDRRQRIDGTTTETFGGIRVVRTFGRQFSETKRYVNSNHLLVRQQLMVWWRTRLIEIVWEVLIPLASMCLLVYGGWQILQGHLTLGDLMMFLIYLTMLLGPIATLAGTAVQFQNNLAGLDRILDLLSQPKELEDRPNAIQLNRRKVVPSLQIDNVSFRYPQQDRLVLEDIELEIEAGTSLALVGKSGAGKTTLCNLIARFYDPTSGSIRLNGVDLRDIHLHSYRRLLAIVEQDVFLFDGTVRENLAYGRRGATLQEIVRAAEMAAAMEFIEQLPSGLETRIGERGVKLSGGQRQRLAIARAMLADPLILILDEATSNLDSENEQKIQASLSTLLQDRTSIMIAHRLSTISRAHQIAVLDNGRLIERGSHAELMERSGDYSRMVILQTASMQAVSS